MEPPGRTLLARLETFRRSDADRDRMVEQLIQSHADLLERYREKCSDCENESKSRRMWQKKARGTDSAGSGDHQSPSSNAFAVAVIDGNDLPFRDFLYAKGKDGGAEAARLLHDELKDQLKRFHPNEDVTRWDIYATVFLDVQGSATTLQSCGLVSDSAERVTFGRAFNKAKPLFQFQFTNEEGGEERPGYSARETLRSFLPVTQCKHVFFGPCNDTSYLRVLNSYKRDHPMNSRLTLIEGKPAVPAFVNLGFDLVKLPAVFDSNDVPSKLGMYGIGENVRTSSSDDLLLCSPSSLREASASFAQPALSSPSPSSNGPSSAKLVVSGGPPVPRSWSPSMSDLAALGERRETKMNSVASTSAAARKFVYLNVHGQRLDVALPACDKGAQFRLFQRVKEHGKLCNKYHLQGDCNGEFCDYEHGDPLTKGEKLVLIHKARSLACPKKSSCREPDCYLGHQCQFGDRCIFDVCRLKDTHGIDSEPATKVYEDGTEESLLAVDENDIPESVS